jgi:hypothetical protein
MASVGIGAKLEVAAGVATMVGIGIGVLDKTSKSFTSATFKILVCLLYSPTANILLPIRVNRSKLFGTSKVIASDDVVIKKYLDPTGLY